VHAPMSNVGGLMYDKGSGWITVPGNITLLVDRQIVGYFICRRPSTSLSHTSAVPRGEGGQMVIDLQDVDATLADGISRNQTTRVF
jgi:ribosome biogenesis protein BMS1